MVEDSDWNILAFYTRLPDLVGENYYTNRRELWKSYFELNSFVYELKRKVDALVLIVSDHGMQRFGDTPYGKHSDYAFFSMNQLGWKPSSILDYYSFMRDRAA